MAEIENSKTESMLAVMTDAEKEKLMETEKEIKSNLKMHLREYRKLKILSREMKKNAHEYYRS